MKIGPDLVIRYQNGFLVQVYCLGTACGYACHLLKANVGGQTVVCYSAMDSCSSESLLHPRFMNLNLWLWWDHESDSLKNNGFRFKIHLPVGFMTISESGGQLRGDRAQVHICTPDVRAIETMSM